MKLLEQFKQELKNLGELRYIWFTSFNISLEFIETYLLPAVLDMEPPRNRLDYEHFQLALNERGINFRVFCDTRFMEAEQNKRTSIPVHGVSTARLEGFSKNSLFHPKVIYMEDVHGNRILGSGSANLTLSGWGRNQEVFRFLEIETREQYSSVKEFFDLIAENVGIEEDLPQRRGLPTHDKGWSFVHSFQEDTFLDQLFDKTHSRDLMVWSPYLSDDLTAFIEKMKNEVAHDELNIHLVPDRIHGQYIRTAWNDALKLMVDSKALVFYDNPTERHENVELCHAKVWKLGGKLAIGSWNFTTPGSNLCNGSGEWDKASNIEAGLILSEPGSWQQAVGKPIAMNSNNFAPIELLEEESLLVPEPLPFDIGVNFDWREQRYSFSGYWNDGNLDRGYSIKVPGISETIPLAWRNKKDPGLKSRLISSPDELLIERRFEVHSPGNVVHRGLITETNTSFRRTQAFASLGDLLDAYVFDGEPGPDDSIPFHPAINRNSSEFDGDVLDDSLVNMTKTGENISYFRLFQAMQQYVETIDAVTSVDKLNGHIFSQPGCLLELVEKTKALIQKVEPCVFNWFLAHEVKSLCMLAKKRRRAIGNDKHSLPKTRWDAIDIDIPPLPENVDINGGYVEMVEKECHYVTR